MIYNGATIKVKMKDGTFVRGEALERCDFGNENFWWVRYSGNTSVFEETELLSWNTSRPCVCGAASVGSPGHAHYCDYNEVLGV